MDETLKRVEHLDKEKVFACTFENGEKYFLKQSDIPDNIHEKIDHIIVDEMGSHFTVKYISGEESVVPWDFIKSRCDEKYEYYHKKIEKMYKI